MTTQNRCSMQHVIDSARWYQGCERVEFQAVTPSSITLCRHHLDRNGRTVWRETITLQVQS